MLRLRRLLTALSLPSGHRPLIIDRFFYNRLIARRF